MGFFRDVDEGKVTNDDGLNAEDMMESLDDITIDDAFASMGDIMTAEEALASLDEDYVKEMEAASDEQAENESETESEMPDFSDIIGDDMEISEETAEEESAEEAVEEEPELTLEEVMADMPEMDIPEDVEFEAEDIAEGHDMSVETTVISKGTTIRGGISSDCSLQVMGVITGDVECQGKLSIFGTVSGNTSASEIYVETDHKLNGDLISTGCVNISEKSVVIGTIQATSAEIAGSVKGDIDIDGPVVVDSTAVIFGNITAKSLQLNTGAVVQGICNIGTKDVDITSIFGE